MAKESAASLGNDRTMLPGLQRSAPKSLGDQSTLGGLDTSAAMSDQDDLEIVDLAKRYQIEGLLGQGGMGEVLLATDTRLKRKVAIKRVLGPIAQSKSALARFVTEAQSIAALSHPNVVQIYDYGRSSDGPFLIMEYVDGGTLLDQCAGGAIPLETAVELACQLCEGLGRAHAAGIIHRDIKPANVLMTRDGTAKLTDFGLAKIEIGDNGITMTGAVLGTVDFMSPEQRRDVTLTDARSDLWSLAATLYQLLTGKSPRIIRLDQVPAVLAAFMNKALEDAPSERFQTAIEFRDALRASLASRSAPLPEPLEQLATGECPKCRSRNETHRKFCSECAGALRVNCLKCDAEIPVWDKVCAECGGKQADLITDYLSTLQQQRNHAEQLRLESQYQAALKIAKEVTSVTDERLTQYRPWAEEFLKSTQEQWDNERAAARQHFAEAQRHRAAFDYPSAIRTIHSIAEPLRLAEVTTFLDRLESDHRESRDLLQTIAGRIKQRDIDGLLEQVDRAIELNGDRADLLKLQSQLRDRETKLAKQRDHVFDQASKLLAEGKAREALSAVRAVRIATLPEQARLTKKLEQIVNSEDVLKKLVEEAKADGVIDSRQVVALLPEVFDYLKLNPHHVNAIKTCDYLLSRLPTISSIQILQLPAKVLSSLPAEVLGKFPAEVLCKLSVEVLSKLPAKTLEKLYVTNSFGIKLRLIGYGEFMMGSPASEANRRNDETQHRVTLTKSYYLGTTQVTQGQWESVMGTTPWKGQDYVKEGNNHAASYVSWDDAMKFCRKLSYIDGKTYRLPTEAEWEYACRGGSTTAYSFGDDAALLSEYGWWGACYLVGSGEPEESDHAVGTKRPNGFGLYDMHGNVFEWCSDWYGDYPTGIVTDPRGAAVGSLRVYRGGSWVHGAAHCRSAHRNTNDPTSRNANSGFRLALSPSIQSPEAGQGK